MRGLKEERVVIAADKAVEGCELSGRKGLDIPWRNVPILQSRLMISLHIHRLAWDSKASTDNVVCDSKQQLLEYGCRRLVRFNQVAPIFLRSYRGARHGCCCTNWKALAFWQSALLT